MILLAPFFKKNLKTLSSSESFVLKRFFCDGLSSKVAIRLSGLSKFSFEKIKMV